MKTCKVCGRCGEQKPLEAFGKMSAQKDGLHYYCKPCTRIVCKISNEKRASSVKPTGSKRCPHCAQVKPIAEFGSNRTRKDGLNNYCKACERSRANQVAAAKRAANPSKIRVYTKTWKTGNRAWMRYIDSRTRAKDLTLRGSLRRWHAALVQATPAWLTPEMWLEMGAIYEQSYLSAQDTTVDHIVPLVGEDADGKHIVCGLHVPWNLQLLSNFDNGTKGRYFHQV